MIDVELEQIRSIRSDLQARRDKAQNIINLASIVTGGAFGAVTSAMQFKPDTVNLGNGIGVVGGAGSVLLSIIGIHKKGGRGTLGDSPRMLARDFWAPAGSAGNNSKSLSSGDLVLSKLRHTFPGKSDYAQRTTDCEVAH